MLVELPCGALSQLNTLPLTGIASSAMPPTEVIIPDGDTLRTLELLQSAMKEVAWMQLTGVAEDAQPHWKGGGLGNQATIMAHKKAH